MSAKTGLVHRPFDSVLVANRGEIACRLIRAVQDAGLRAVAVHSDPDAGALHCRLADAAAGIGGATAAESYLDVQAILDAARRSGAQAVHPGYGFLSENADFAQACLDAGLVWIGPSPESMRLMGNKATARQLMQERGVPCTPGYQGDDQSPARLRKEAERIGIPVMVKAAAGGGGRGMRLVQDAGELEAALESAASEAQSAFGSGELILEKAVMGARHIEVQVLGDGHGSLVHLGERDCSVQRRNQKVLEEAPSPALDEDARQRVCQAGVEAARAVGYCNAGTVEFLYDSQSGEFYFLEMNTRLQVEHPVTELVTGLDLAQLQLAVAAGDPLPFAQEDVVCFGHAVEARVYAEDPAKGFLPRTGPVDLWRVPQGDGVRVDHGLAEGSRVSPYYDPMLAKVVAWGDTRRQACARLARALDETQLAPVTTNLVFLRRALRHPAFLDGSADTSFVAHEMAALAPAQAQAGERDLAVAALLQYAAQRRRHQAAALSLHPQLANWRSSGNLTSSYRYQLPAAEDTDDGGDAFDVRLVAESGAADSYRAFVTPAGAPGQASAAAPNPSSSSDSSNRGGGKTGAAKSEKTAKADSAGGSAAGVAGDRASAAKGNAAAQPEAPASVEFALQLLEYGDCQARIRVDGLTQTARFAHLDPTRLLLRAGPDELQLTNLLATAGLAESAGGGNRLTAPLHGRLAKLAVKEGDQVRKGDLVAIVEAMKMEHKVEAQRSGKVAAVHAQEGQQVDAGALLAELADPG